MDYATTGPKVAQEPFSRTCTVISWRHYLFVLSAKAQTKESKLKLRGKSLGRPVNTDPLKQGAGKRVNAPSLRASIRATARAHLDLLRKTEEIFFLSRLTDPERKTESREY